MRNKFTCDLCGQEVTERSWEDVPTRMYFENCCASQNPLGAYGYGHQRAVIDIKDTCQRCQRVISQTLGNVIASLKHPASPRGGVGE